MSNGPKMVPIQAVPPRSPAIVAVASGREMRKRVLRHSIRHLDSRPKHSQISQYGKHLEHDASDEHNNGEAATERPRRVLFRLA
eukprot:CAMPEP_0174858102 /NCGR_PEP_ID=MMETSP1114-20130205/41369_1 /TAXON_ID=312471 /ORGANISM="Neobodo designis, Strain CCAP 1951/1" /LENGTH=83 /DNA_ID=CAMNT_0016092987 /DNA_START=33 /DNA_END=281 /DNA_ORIENTATION=-